jgi:4-amino-4-deoxy-L-arabinose transferase-like glycosyltransferase
LISLVWGAIVCLAVASVWYLPMYIRHSSAFVNEFFIQHHFERFTSNKYQHPQPFYFFFWVLPLMTIPWLPIFVSAVWTQTKDLIRKIRFAASEPSVAERKERSLVLFTIAWLLVPLIFFSFSGSKLPGYILPSVPAAVLLTGLYISKMLHKRPSSGRWIKAIALATYMTIVLALLFVVPRFVRTETVKTLIKSADSHGFPQLQVAEFGTISHNAEYYAAGRLIRDDDGKQHRFNTVRELSDRISASDNRRMLVLIPLDHVKQLTMNEMLSTQVLDDNGELAIAAVSLK